jgi:hypothetical protein
LDVPTGSQTENYVLKSRYWTVFKPTAFEDLIEDSES